MNENKKDWRDALAKKARAYLEKYTHEILWVNGTQLTTQRNEVVWKIADYKNGYFNLEGRYGAHIQNVMRCVGDLRSAMGGGLMRDLVPEINLGSARLNLPKVEIPEAEITDEMEWDIQNCSNIPFWKEGVGEQFTIRVDITGRVSMLLNNMSLIPRA